MATSERSPDRTEPIDLLAAHQPADTRPAVSAIVALDRHLRAIHAGTTEPLIGQMRLLWWHDALERLDHAPAPAVPLLEEVQRAGLRGADLAELIAPWEVLIDPAATERERDEAVARRGEDLFALVARVMGAAPGIAPGIADAGAAWSLADAARWAGVNDADSAQWHDAARKRRGAAVARTWPRGTRAFLLPAHAAARPVHGMAMALRVAAFLSSGWGTLLADPRSA